MSHDHPNHPDPTAVLGEGDVGGDTPKTSDQFPHASVDAHGLAPSAGEEVHDLHPDGVPNTEMPQGAADAENGSPQTHAHSFPGDVVTGALFGFNRTQHKQPDHTPEQDHAPEQQASSSTTEAASSVEEPEDFYVPQCPVVASACANHLRNIRIEVDPACIAAGGILECNIDSGLVSQHAISHPVSGKQWSQAKKQLTRERPVVFNCIGHPVYEEYVIGEHAMLLEGQMMCHHLQNLPLLEQALNNVPRRVSALHQGPAVSDDEMTYYLSSLNGTVMEGEWKALKPLVIDGLCDIQSQAIAWLHEMTQQPGGASMILWGHHWVPIVFTTQHAQVHIRTTPFGSSIWPMLGANDNIFQVMAEPEIPQQFPWDCGFQAFAWLVGALAVAPAEPLTSAAAAGWRKLFWQQTILYPTQGRVRLRGQGELETALMALLREHGVPVERVHDRMKMVLSRMPHEQLTGIFQAPRPWQALKHAANSQVPKVRLAQEDELQATIRTE